eukprot:Rhum_TRINITY_DN15299_c3_g1::Rhum_TRINITY_DN15299_c3_g1_i5::g.149552::m.149552
MVRAGNAVTLALACVVAGVAADTRVLAPYGLLDRYNYEWYFKPPSGPVMTVGAVNIYSENVATNSSCPTAKFSVGIGCEAGATACTGLTANEQIEVLDGQSHMVQLNVIIQTKGPGGYVGMLTISVQQNSACPTTVTPTVHYTLEGAATFAPTPAPTLPPHTPLQTWVGNNQSTNDSPSWLFWPGGGPPNFQRFTFYSFELTATIPAGCTGKHIIITTGCFPGLNPPTCTGYSVTQRVAMDSTTVTFTTPMLVTTYALSVQVFQLTPGPCSVMLTPTARYSSLPPPTSAPPVPTPSPRTPAPLAPGGLCPQHESQSPGTVPTTPCGAAACRTPTYHPLNRMTQACDPCVGGMLPFDLEVQKGTTADYTITFVTGAGKTLTLDAACGSCVTMRGLSIEIPCREAGGEDSGRRSGLASWVAPVIVAAAIAGGALIGLGVVLLTRRKDTEPRVNAELMRALALQLHDQQELQALGDEPLAH